MTEIEKLQAALKWAIENHVGESSVRRGVFYDGGCGCCSDEIEVPEEFKDVVLAAVGETNHD